MPAKHSNVVGGSTAGITLKCNGSIIERRKVPNDCNIYAATGTALHKVCEIALSEDVDEKTVLKRFTDMRFADLLEKQEEIEEFGHHIMTEELLRKKALPALAWVRNYIVGSIQHGERINLYFEDKVGFAYSSDSPYNDDDEGDLVIEGAFGIVDVIFEILNKQGKPRRVGVLDFKFGDGEIVDPQDNTQGMFYLTGAIHTAALPDVDEYEFWIYQPAAKLSPENYARCATYTQRDLDNFIFTLADTVKADTEYNPGPHCRRCKGKITCAAFNDLIVQTEKTDIDGLDNKDLASKLDMLDALKAYATEVHTHALRNAKLGVKIPGWTLDDGTEKGNSKYRDEKAADGALMRMGMPSRERKISKLISPAQAIAWLRQQGTEKAVLDKFTKRHVMRPDTAEKLVRTPPGEVDGDAFAKLAQSLELTS